MVALDPAREVETREIGRRRRPRRGGRRYLLVAVDAIAAGLAALAVYLVRQTGLRIAHHTSVTRDVLLVALPLIWVLGLAAHRTYAGWVAVDARTRNRVAQTALTLIAAMASACLALQYTNLLDLILLGLPLAAALTWTLRVVGRWWWRRRHGAVAVRRVLIVGPAAPIAGLLAAMGRDHLPDLRVVAACLVEDADDEQIGRLPVPVYGNLSNVPDTAGATGCDAVIVSPCARLNAVRLRQLSWDLQDAGVELLVAPALAEVAQERIAVRPAGAVPLLHVRAPMFTGPQRVLKGLLDRCSAALLLGFAAPAMLVITLLIRTTSPGPALFRQRRVGRGGAEFTCYKFRTMVVDAEARRAEVAALNDRSDGLLFKIRHDPRVTKVGAVLRRYSLDELPQLLNVLSGDMSLVGPRPPLPQEVAGYNHAVRRRLLVKPGLTGLWQVSGRSDLSWDESVRLDLNYVDNWSPALDARILLRTVVAVLRGTGAY